MVSLFLNDNINVKVNEWVRQTLMIMIKQFNKDKRAELFNLFNYYILWFILRIHFNQRITENQ